VVVTSTDVGLRQWPLPCPSAPREAIKVVHWYSQNFTFLCDGQRVLLKIGGLGWTGGQLLDRDAAEPLRMCARSRSPGGGFRD
jgi:hypothetical protein